MNVIFEGHVQGVGFRFTTVEIARDFEVVGYVLNLMDGGVKLVAEGTEAQLMAFLRALREAPIYRYVTKENLSWSSPTEEFSSFSIRYG